MRVRVDSRAHKAYAAAPTLFPVQERLVRVVLLLVRPQVGAVGAREHRVVPETPRHLLHSHVRRGLELPVYRRVRLQVSLEGVYRVFGPEDGRAGRLLARCHQRRHRLREERAHTHRPGAAAVG